MTSSMYLAYCYISCYVIAETAIGPGPQAVDETARWNRRLVVFGMQPEMTTTYV